MDRHEFWQIINTAKEEGGDNLPRRLEVMERQLRQRSPAEIAEFHQVFWQVSREAYTWDLWAAAYIINGGCSDDGFEYFRWWLISAGEKAYTSALKDPDSLVEVCKGEDNCEFEDIASVAPNLYEELTGKSIPQEVFERTQEPKGKRWEEDDELDARLPRLCAAYRENDR